METALNYMELANSWVVTIPEKALFAISLAIVFQACHSAVFRFLLNRTTVFLALMLPVIILLITQAISTNFYLSLGLIGALSVVRYRTPVKSQYELAYIFALIAIGLITGVNPGMALLLTFILCMFPALYFVASHVLPSLSADTMRINSDGRTELNLLLPMEQIDHFPLPLPSGRLIRMDKNFKANEVFFLISFDTAEEAYRFEEAMVAEPISLSISVS